MGFLITFLIIETFAVLGFLVLFFLFFVLLPILKGAPFVPISKEKIERAIELVGLKPGQKIADLGSGDGRILIACAKKGVRAVGFERIYDVVGGDRQVTLDVACAGELA